MSGKAVVSVLLVRKICTYRQKLELSMQKVKLVTAARECMTSCPTRGFAAAESELSAKSESRACGQRLAASSRRQRIPHTVKAPAPDLVQRNFTAVAPNQVWVGDITYLWTAEGWQYLAVFIDLYSRMVVGWALGTRLTASLVTLALARAALRRRPKAGLIVHTDQGAQYTSAEYRRALTQLLARQSMGSRGDCYDNAVAESFFHSFKVEAIYGSDIETRLEMQYKVFEYIGRFYNKKIKHSSIGLRSPEQFENGATTNQKAAA